MNAQAKECTDGYECSYCRNKGVYYALDNDGEIYSTSCPECGHIRKSIYLLKLSGLDSLTFESFKTTADWQGKLLALAREYACGDSQQWFFIGGQSGAGKTHLCSATIHELIFTHHTAATVLHWIENGRRLKSLVNSDDYDKEKDKYINAPVLYIDDFFKTKSGESVSAADVRLAFEIIGYRYNNKLKTIISSEKFLSDVIGIDEAVGGRIKQMAGKYALSIKHDLNKNYRITI